MDENQNENLDSTNEEVVVTEETSEQSNEEAEILREQNKKLFERAKKAEAEAKALKAQSAPQQINNPTVDVEELKLIARGLSDEEIDQAKVIAKGIGSNLTEAMKNPLFIAYQTSRVENKRKEDARLGASNGSGLTQEELEIKPDMSRDEHKAKFEELTQS